MEADLEGGWYAKAVEYWDAQPATDDGVLGGHADAVSVADVQQSEAFLRKVLGPGKLEAGAAAGGGKQAALTAADCGAGVGRVSKDLLLRFFAAVDLVEPSAHLLDAARSRLAAAVAADGGRLAGKPRAFVQSGLQAWKPAPGTYDVVWVQWALLYLTDGEMGGGDGEEKVGGMDGWGMETGGGAHCFSCTPPPHAHTHSPLLFTHSADAISFMRRAAAALKPGGVLVVKENIAAAGFVVDKDDRSLTRSHPYMLDLGRAAGLTAVADARQRGFPAGLFGVRMYAWRG